ncbi:Pimeloyl-ACP methyl ester carboxylesterase [Allokutzneria albata]|uniref:Pimeloyl-ACP methyl ester carboxylesterase n=2 Tax=Allokutzneria albata TaxID=211114 RepID=A0A1H0B202_ALLAB|nr:Pimeloyl-ACP methyl ester carboxylesterase [Allokutzneria albata]
MHSIIGLLSVVVMSTVTLGGITFGYDDLGSGEQTLVLVHGHPFDRSMWRPQTEHFAERGFRVIAADLRGYGETTVVPGKTLLSTFAKDIATLLDHRGADRFVLGGLSMGGQIVMECHRQFPERITGLVLADTTAEAETGDGRRNRAEMAARLLREGMRPYAEEVLWKMVAEDEAAAEHVLRMMLAAPPEGAAAALLGRAERPDYLDMLGRVAVPALVVVGTEDEYTPISDARLMHDRLPDSTLVVVEGAAHMPNLERTEEFNGALHTFLDSIAARTER